MKRAILVHEGIFGSMDGEVRVDAGRCQRVAANMNALYAKMGHEYGGSVPVGAYPAVLDQHADDSNDRVYGRVTGDFKAEIRDIPMVGKQLWCVTGNLTFMGDESIERVKDGRIYHLSVCLGETSETIGEVSSVIEPAAPGAMLLSKGKRLSGRPSWTFKAKNEGSVEYKYHTIWYAQRDDGVWFWAILHPIGEDGEGSSKADAIARAKPYIDSETKDWHLAADKRLSAAKALRVAIEKTLGSEKKAPPLVPPSSLAKNRTTGDSRMPKALLQKRLAAKKERITALKALTAGSDDSVRLAKEKKESGVRLAAEAKVTARLSGLMKSGRMTPAEFKKQDIKRLAAMKSDDFEATAAMWDTREPVILPGQRGSTAAPAASDLVAQAGSDNFKRLKAEAQEDVYKRLGRKAPKGKETDAAKLARSVDAEVEFRLGAGKRMAEEEGEEKKKLGEQTKCMGEMEKCLEAGDLDGAKKHMGEFKKLGLGGAYAGGDLVAEGLEKVLSEQQQAIDQLHVQLAKLNDALKLMLAAEEAEEQEMAGEAAEGEEGAELEEGGDPAADPAAAGKGKELGAEGGEKAPPAKKEGEDKAPPPKKEGEDKAPPKKEGEEK